jgi:cell cycle sensor histidine kinase DivJ
VDIQRPASGILLLVEDEPDMLDVLEAILSAEGYTVLRAIDGLQALEVLNALPTPPDMIIADIMMPRMDGLELLRKVRENEQWLHVPFTFLTARDTPRDIVLGKSMGADEYIAKPFEVEDFLKLIAARLQRYRALANAQTNRVQDLKRQILTLLNHEFRTPLTLIVAYTNMVKHYDQAQAMTPEQLMEFLANISAGAQRLRRMIENFVLLAELQYGDGQAAMAWRMRRIDDPRRLFEDALELVTRDISAHVIETDIAPDLPRFTGDADSLAIALRELIDNAVKFSARGTTITLSAQVRDGHLYFMVRDCGRGMPPEQLAKIGAAFYQIDRHSTEDQGIGAGLAIVDAIARLHEARVHFQSRTGQGTTVSLVLPLDHHF